MTPTGNMAQITKPQAEESVEEVDLRAVYLSYEYFDENGKKISNLRGVYESGDNDGEAAVAAIDTEGYRNFTKKGKWETAADLTNFDLAPEEWDLVQLNRRVLPIPNAREVMGHTTIHGHEYVPHGRVESLLTQNPEHKGKVDDGCGEYKGKHRSPPHHPISFRPDYEYWDDGRYPSSKIPDSRATFEVGLDLELQCPENKRPFRSDIVYINPHNDQTYLWCPYCARTHWNAKHTRWHQITDPKTLEKIGDEIGIKLVRYNKLDTEEKILELVRAVPGINRYRIGLDLQMDKGTVSRGIARLKKKGQVRTKRVGKSIRVYPNS